MPTRGYRKGLSDDKEPLPRLVRTRVSEREYQALVTDAQARGMVVSRLTRSLITAHVSSKRPALPQPNGRSAEFIHQLTRIGNNLNQLARLAHQGLLAQSPDALVETLASINGIIRRC